MTPTELIVHKQLEIAATPEHAFAVFTERLGDWWPMQTHSICEDADGTVAFADGLVVETTPQGERHEWADVLALEPPHRILLNWRVNPERADTRLEITFTPTPTGCRLDLHHSGFDDAGRSAAYTDGWDPVLASFAATAAGAET